MILSRTAKLFWAAFFSAALFGCTGGGTVSAGGILSVSAQGVDFGEVPVLSNRTASLSICNVGRGKLGVFGFEVSASDASGASGLQVSKAPSTIESGTCAEAVLAYRPESRGSLDAVLRFSSDDSAQSSISIPVKAVSTTQAKISVPEVLDAGEVCEGGGKILLASLGSSGNADLEIYSASVEGDEGVAFLAGSSSMPMVIAPGESAALAIQVAPVFGISPSARAELILSTNDPDASSIRIPLKAAILPAPKADIAPFPPIAPGGILSLDGSGSAPAAAESAPLTFSWTLKNAPLDSYSSISAADSALASFTVDAPGQYDFSLTVRDARGCASQPAEASATAQTAEGLRFELFWDNLNADLDLHLAPAGAEFFSAMDCHYSDESISPDWGIPGITEDDPVLIRDALTGYGPEVISFPSPGEGSYRAMVHYYSAHHNLFPETTATLRIYKFGVLAAEQEKVMTASDEIWEAAEVVWPGGEIRILEEKTEGD